MKSIPLSRRHWASKQMSSHFAHGNNMVQWKQQTSAECPHCAHHQEDKQHILCCTQVEVTSRWTTSLQQLKDWLQQQQTEPLLVELLITGLQARRDKEPMPTNSLLALWQLALGWEAVLDRWFSLAWQEHQEAYWSQWQQ